MLYFRFSRAIDHQSIPRLGYQSTLLGQPLPHPRRVPSPQLVTAPPSPSAPAVYRELRFNLFRTGVRYKRASLQVPHDSRARPAPCTQRRKRVGGQIESSDVIRKMEAPVLAREQSARQPDRVLLKNRLASGQSSHLVVPIEIEETTVALPKKNLRKFENNLTIFFLLQSTEIYFTH